MKRIILFSQPQERNFQEVLALLFPPELKHREFAYMPANGLPEHPEYLNLWQTIARDHGATLHEINNAAEDQVRERERLLSCTILLITGGNTFELLRNLRQSGLDQVVLEFTNKADFVLAGFSAGALVLTPSIRICNLEAFNDNLVGLQDLDGLGIVPFEVFPHYTDQWLDALAKYRQETRNEVRPIRDDEQIVIDR